MLAHLCLIAGELDASGLPAAADQDLRLDDDGVADLVGGARRLIVRAHGPAGRNIQPVTGEELLALVLQQVHAARDSSGEGVAARARARRS